VAKGVSDGKHESVSWDETARFVDNMEWMEFFGLMGLVNADVSYTGFSFLRVDCFKRTLLNQ